MSHYPEPKLAVTGYKSSAGSQRPATRSYTLIYTMYIALTCGSSNLKDFTYQRLSVRNTSWYNPISLIVVVHQLAWVFHQKFSCSSIIHRLKVLLYKDSVSKMYRKAVLEGRGFKPKFQVIITKRENMTEHKKELEAIKLLKKTREDIRQLEIEIGKLREVDQQLCQQLSERVSGCSIDNIYIVVDSNTVLIIAGEAWESNDIRNAFAFIETMTVDRAIEELENFKQEEKEAEEKYDNQQAIKTLNSFASEDYDTQEQVDTYKAIKHLAETENDD